MYVIQVPPLKINKTPLSLTYAFGLPSLSLSCQSSFLEEESTLAIFSSYITHSILLHSGVLLSWLHGNCSYWRSPMTLKHHIHGALFCHFSGVCHWHCPLLSPPSFLPSLGFYDMSSLDFFLLLCPSLLSSTLPVFLCRCPNGGQLRFYPWPASLPIVSISHCLYFYCYLNPSMYL